MAGLKSEVNCIATFLFSLFLLQYPFVIICTVLTTINIAQQASIFEKLG